MTTILLAYSATTYLFSGSCCYLAFLKDKNKNSEDFSSSKLSLFWITFLWPIWIIKGVKAQDRDSQSEIKTILPQIPEYLSQTAELTSTSSSVVR